MMKWENVNKAHHRPQCGASYNHDESMADKYAFQNVQGRFIPPNVSNMPTQPQQQQQSSSEEGSKENTILNGPRHQKEMGAQDHPSGPADSMPQGPAPTAPTHTSQTGGPPRAPPVNNQNVEGCQTHNHHQYMTQDHQDLPECDGTTSGSTRAPGISGKGPGPAKGKSKTSEPQPGTSSGTGSTSQPTESSKNTIVCSACGESGHWSKNCPYYNFCDVCKVTTHPTHMCRVSKHGNATARSPVCIYCGTTNHGLAYCRYEPKDNCEEPRNTPDTLRTGTAGKNSASAPRNQTRPTLTIIIMFLSLIQMAEHRVKPIEVKQDPNQGVSIIEINKDLNIEIKLVWLPEANKLVLIQVFLLGDSSMLILMKVLTGDILPPHSLLLDLITHLLVMLLVGPSFS